MCVGMARLGQKDQMIIAGTMEELLSADFGAPLHCLAITGEVHPLEEEVRVGAIWTRRMAWSDLVLRWCTADAQAILHKEIDMLVSSTLNFYIPFHIPYSRVDTCMYHIFTYHRNSFQNGIKMETTCKRTVDGFASVAIRIFRSTFILRL